MNDKEMRKTFLHAGLLMGALMASLAPQPAVAGRYSPKVRQTAIPRVTLMPDLPDTYRMIDWKAKARSFDAYVFDWHNNGKLGPFIWLDDHRRNIDQTTFGLYTAVADVRQGPDHNGGEFHEALTSLSALLGAGLVGIDKTRQDGYNYVKMVQNYFNCANGWNIMMNNTNPQVAHLGGGYGRDWWYDVLPNALYYAVSDVFPGVSGADGILRSIAEQFCKADSVLNGNYDYSFFDYGRMRGGRSQIPYQQDAAGGHAYVLLCAYHKFGDPRYLRHSESATEALLSQKESRFYEALLPLGVYTAAYLNATQGKHYDTDKLINWVFDGCQSPTGRTGWGIITGKWGRYDVDGLQGSTTDGGGYAFLMNSIKPLWPFVPMVKYAPQYAAAIGKWVLNNASACRVFFPGYIDKRNQWAAEYRDITGNHIAYEGLRKADDYGMHWLRGVSPVAIGDGPKWIAGNPTLSMMSVYSTAPIGILGGIIDTTDVVGILRLNCNATDFYAPRPYPVYLVYNPYPTEQSITWESHVACDLFDVVAQNYVARGLRPGQRIAIPAKSARLIYQLPCGAKLTRKGGRIIAAGRHVIYYGPTQ